MKIKKYLQAAFLFIGALTVCEFIFVRGMFTWLIVVTATLIAGTVNIIFTLKDKEWLQALTFLLATVALCMGYFVIL